MGSRAHPSIRRGRYGPEVTMKARLPPEWQFDKRRSRLETDAYEHFYRGDARVHAMASPYLEDEYGARNTQPEKPPPPMRRRSTRRTYSLGDLDSPPEGDGYALGELFSRDDGLYDAMHGGKSGRPKGPWSGVLSSLFSCVAGNCKKNPPNRHVVERRARELLDLNRRQESALADKQDTIDILQWKLQQLQLVGQNNERWMSGGSKRFTPARARDSTAEEVRHKGSFESLSGYLSSLKIMDNDQLAVLVLFDTSVMRTRIAVRCFCRIFMKQMEASGYAQVWKALSDMEPRTIFARKEHAAFVLESHINRALFHSFESESFDDAGITKIIDPVERCAVRLEEYEILKSVDAVDAVNGKHRLFDPEFLRFCDSKMREMWFLFPWNIVFHSSEQRAVFTGSFLDAAKNVWLLHRLAHAANPACSILRVGRGTVIDARYVEVVAIPPYETCRKCVKPRVEFMTMPGFRAHQRVTKCQVYQHFSCR